MKFGLQRWNPEIHSNPRVDLILSFLIVIQAAPLAPALQIIRTALFCQDLVRPPCPTLHSSHSPQGKHRFRAGRTFERQARHAVRWQVRHVSRRRACKMRNMTPWQIHGHCAVWSCCERIDLAIAFEVHCTAVHPRPYTLNLRPGAHVAVAVSTRSHHCIGRTIPAEFTNRSVLLLSAQAASSCLEEQCPPRGDQPG